MIFNDEFLDFVLQAVFEVVTLVDAIEVLEVLAELEVPVAEPARLVVEAVLEAVAVFSTEVVEIVACAV